MHESRVTHNIIKLYSIIFKLWTSKAKKFKIIAILVTESCKRIFQLIYIKAAFGKIINKISKTITELIKLPNDLNSVSKLTIKVTYSIAIPSCLYICFKFFITIVVKTIRKN